jgi:hypothetical protein
MAALIVKPKPINLPNDPRFEHRFANVNGTRYHYLFAEPKDRVARATVVLVSVSPNIASHPAFQHMVIIFTIFTQILH